MSDTRVEVRQVPERHRFEILVDGARVGLVTYRDSGATRTFVHTETNPDRQERGLAGQLVKHALDKTRADGLHVVPECSYVAAFIERHPEYADLVA